MQLYENEVERIARLAKLSFSEDEKHELLVNMNKVLKLVEKLNELDTENVPPLVYMIEEENRLRDDVAETENIKAQLLANAPSKDSDYFKVPKVLKK